MADKNTNGPLLQQNMSINKLGAPPRTPGSQLSLL
jgi:hypothetical protein